MPSVDASSPDEVDLVVVSRRVVAGDRVGPAAVHVAGGRIVAITDPDDLPTDDLPAGVEVHDHGDAVCMAGLVDTHVHVNEPGRTEWEGFASATRAAAAGGTTTIVDMPLNSVPPTTTVANLEEKRAAADGRCAVDVGFWGGIVPGNDAELEPLLDAGVLGFKAFLTDSGVEEFPPVSPAALRKAAPTLAAAGVPLLVHAELDAPMRVAQERLARASADARRAYATYLASRPPEAEDAAVADLATLAREERVHVHVLHLSSAGALTTLARARGDGVPLTAETCPHYLVLDAGSVPDGATEYKCAPPIRDAANRERLWEGLAAGDISMVVSDHSPCLPELKAADRGDFAAAWGGISSLQLRLPLTWTAARERGIDLATLGRWLAAEPARLAGLAPRKGTLVPGADADLVVWDPDAAFTVDPDALLHRHTTTPYAGRRLHGRVLATYLRGRRIADGASVDPASSGRLLGGQG